MHDAALFKEKLLIIVPHEGQIISGLPGGFPGIMIEVELLPEDAHPVPNWDTEVKSKYLVADGHDRNLKLLPKGGVLKGHDGVRYPISAFFEVPRPETGTRT